MMFVSSSGRKIAERLEKEYAIMFGEKNLESASENAASMLFLSETQDVRSYLPSHLDFNCRITVDLENARMFNVTAQVYSSEPKPRF
jgi:hypothetical protein